MRPSVRPTLLSGRERAHLTDDVAEPLSSLRVPRCRDARSVPKSPGTRTLRLPASPPPPGVSARGGGPRAVSVYPGLAVGFGLRRCDVFSVLSLASSCPSPAGRREGRGLRSLRLRLRTARGVVVSSPACCPARSRVRVRG